MPELAPKIEREIKQTNQKETERATISPSEKQQVQTILQWVLPNSKEHLIPLLYKLFQENSKQSKTDQDTSWS